MMINPKMFNELLDKAADPVCIAAGLSPKNLKVYSYWYYRLKIFSVNSKYSFRIILEKVYGKCRMKLS